MTRKNTRRNFLKGTAAAGVGFWAAGGVSPRESRAANEEIRFGCIGIGGKGGSDSNDAKRHGKVLAICDVDDARLDRASRGFPDAKKYNDYRKLLDEMGKSIDAVTVSTPDHTHAIAASKAMLMGKHCFVQKPLTHSIFEARRLGEIAREKKLATQMGNQGTASNGLRKGTALMKAGVLGTVKECHVWTNRPVWAQGGPRPKAQEPPKNLHWDLWLSEAPERPYGPGYHPFSWRGWWDFGTGTLGDMACHTVNLPFMGLDLANPTAVEAKSSGHNKDSYPKWSSIVYDFPANDWRPAIKFVWYDGGQRPPKELIQGSNIRIGGAGCLVIGDKAMLHSGGDYGTGFSIFPDVERPKVEYPRSPGHFTEWANAIKGGPPTMSNFENYAGPLTETILLGNLAVWAEKRVEWDAKAIKATNAPEVEKVVRPDYRPGYSLEG